MGCVASSTAPARVVVVVPFANPANFRRRLELHQQTVNTLLHYATESPGLRDRVTLVVVESLLDYSANASEGEPVVSIEWKSPLHAIVRTVVPQDAVWWHKENLVNLGLRYAGIGDAAAVAWLDGDVALLNERWAEELVEIVRSERLKGRGVLVQLFREAELLGPLENAEIVSQGFVAQWMRNQGKYHSYHNCDPEYYHPGFAWALDGDTARLLYHRLDGAVLPEGTFGSCDRHMALAVLGKVKDSVPSDQTEDYSRSLHDWEAIVRSDVARVTLRFVPGTLRHFFHGELRNRLYWERWGMLWSHQFSPSKHLHRTANGVIVHSAEMPIGLKDELLPYFQQRDEDCVYALRENERCLEEREKLILQLRRDAELARLRQPS